MSYSHKMDFNRRAEEITGIQVLNNVAKAFGMFWWFFGALSIWATYFTMHLVLKDWTIDPIVLIAVTFGLAVIWEIFKYFSIEWIFADQVLSTKITAYAVSTALVFGSMYFHVYGATLRTSDTATKKVSDEVAYQRAMRQQKLDLQNKLIESNKGLESVLNNGTASDDKPTVGTMQMNLKLVEQLQKEKTEVLSSNELLEVYGKDIAVKSDGIMYAQIIAEMFLLFSLLSKFIYKANRDEQLKDFLEAKQALQELLYLAKEENTAKFVNAALDELNGYTINTNRTGLAMIQDKIARARASIRPDKEIEDKTPKQGSYTPDDREPILLGEGLDERHSSVIDECEEVELEECPDEVEIEETVAVANERVRALDLSVFEEDERKMLRILWDNGNIHKGDELVKREVAVIEAAEAGVRRAASALTALYGNLLKSGMISRPNLAGGYVAEVSLKKEIWTDKEPKRA